MSLLGIFEPIYIIHIYSSHGVNINIITLMGLFFLYPKVLVRSAGHRIVFWSIASAPEIASFLPNNLLVPVKLSQDLCLGKQTCTPLGAPPPGQCSNSEILRFFPTRSQSHRNVGGKWVQQPGVCLLFYYWFVGILYIFCIWVLCHYGCWKYILLVYALFFVLFLKIEFIDYAITVVPFFFPLPPSTQYPPSL